MYKSAIAELDSEFGIGWAIAKTEPVKVVLNRSKHHKYYEKVNKISKHLFLCENCNSVWELKVNGKGSIEKYENFPTRGLKRKKCKECK